MNQLENLAWDDVRFFLAALQAGTMSAAATDLRVAQATMSRRIAALEESLGHVLFDRSHGGLAPTDAALRLQPHAEAMAGAAEMAKTALSGLEDRPAGLVRIAVPPGLAFDLLPPLLPVLRERHPDLRLEVLAGNHAVDLVRREADIAIRTHRPTNNDLVFRRMPNIPVRPYAHPDYIARAGVGAAPSDIDWIQYDASMLHIPLAQWVEQVRGDRPVSFSSNSFLAMRQAAIHGCGAMLLPGPQAVPFGLERLDWIDVNLPDLAWYLVIHRALRHVPRVRAVIDLVDDVVLKIQDEQDRVGEG